MAKRIAVICLSLLLAFTALFATFGCSCSQGSKTFTVTFLGGADDAELYYANDNYVQTVSDYTELNPPVYVRPGYNFDGWTIALNEINKDTVVKAMWSRYQFRVTFNANGGKDYMGNTTVVRKVSSGVEIADIAPKFEKTGYDLSWDTDFGPITNACVINAVWTPKQYKISFIDIDGSPLEDENGNIIEDMTVSYEGKLGTLPKPKNKQVGDETLKFSRWLDEYGIPQTTGTYWDRDVKGTIYFKASWMKDDYLIDYDLNGGYAIYNPTSYSKGAEIFINDPMRKGYDFIGWTSEDIVEPQVRVKIEPTDSGNKKFVANWKPKTYTINLDYNGGTAGGSTSVNLTFDQKIGSMPVPERANYEFIGWLYDEYHQLITEDSIWDIEPSDTNRTLVAQYRKIYTIKFTLSTNYKKTPLDCVITDWGDLMAFGDDLEQISIVVKEGESLANHGIRIMPSVDPIEPTTGKPNGRLDDYYFNGYWKFVTKNAFGHELIVEVLPDTVFNPETFADVGEDGVIVIEPSCLGWYTIK